MQKQLVQPQKRAQFDSDAYYATLALSDGGLRAKRKPCEAKGVPRWAIVVAGFVLLAIGGYFIRWTSHRIDHQMRAEILLQAKMVAQAVDFKNVAALSGTDADLSSPDYLRLKEQLSLVCKANPKCRFIYLMGRKSDGNLFFYVDSEDPGSDDYSPPGQIFEEATEDDRQVFEAGVGNADGGPYEDRWGTWISAMVPVFHPETSDVMAVLGMDFNAASWKLDVASKTALWALPAALALLLGIVLLALPTRFEWSYC